MNERQGWYWLVRASRGPVGYQVQFFEQTVDDIKGITNVFKEFMKQEQKHRQDGWFHLDIFHFYGLVVTEHAYYQVNFSRGRELWKGHKPLEAINQAWEESGGIVRG